MLKKTHSLIRRFVLILLVIASSFGLGFWTGNKDEIEDSNSVPAGIIDIITGPSKPDNVDFSLLWEAWQVVNNEYIGEKNSQDRVEGAVKGMVDSLDDPYTTYLSPSNNKLYLADLEGHFDGIGAELTIKDNLITVVAPLEDSPAKKAGLKAQDVIVKVDGQETKDLSFDEAIMKIRGKKGTEVVLTIFRQGEPEEKDYKIIRDTIKIKSVSLEFTGKDQDIALIKINQFGKDTIDLLRLAQKTIAEKKVDKIIVDLRNNPGGLLGTAINVASLFLADDLSKYQDEPLTRGVVVTEEGKNKKKQEYIRSYEQIFDQPIVLLQNKGSASASEIFAGAIKDYNRGKVIGETSFGKGSVQNLADLSNEGSIKVTIARWFTPKGSQINKKGIDPDVKIKDDRNNNQDPILAEAIKILNN